MIRHIVCILFIVLLVGGIKSVSIVNNQQEPQIKTGDVAMYTEDACFVPLSVNAHDTTKTLLFNDADAKYNINDGILCNASIAQCTVASKTLKFNATNLIMHVLSSLDAPLPDNQWKNFSPDTNFIKYSNGYYVYTLGHILI